jgi:hypothetical protein
MDTSIIVPIRAHEVPQLDACLAGLAAQRYTRGQVDVLVVQYGGGPPAMLPDRPRPGVRLLSVDDPTPYGARNLGVEQSRGDLLLFTEPGCVPDPSWVDAHAEQLCLGRATISIGHVVPERLTRPVELLLSYESVRDEWVFSSAWWRNYFGRPKNMAVARRRFATHGPFACVARGADSKLVQSVARDVACDEVVLAPRALVRQQSIRGLPSFLRDRYGHARALQIHQSGHAAPIALADRAALFRDTAARHRYSRRDTVALLLVLGAGVVAFRSGGFAGSLRRRMGFGPERH